MKKSDLFSISFIAAIVGFILYLSTRRRVKNIIEELPGEAWPKRGVDPSEITLHHAASAMNATAQDFNRYHRSEKGWPRIGYHFVIDRSGNIFQVNPVDAYSYHNGYNNKAAIGLCMVGNNDDYPPTAKQVKATKYIIRSLSRAYGIKFLRGHKELPGATTACPGKYNDLDAWRQSVGLSKPALVQYLVDPGKNYNPDQADN